MSTMDRRQDMAMSTTWTGWVGFAAIMMAFIGAITFFEGLIAIIRDNYYVVTRQQVFLFDVSSWGWIMLFWGVLLFIAALGLASKSGWARWFTIILLLINLLSQLSWLGNSNYPLWSLTVIALEIVVLYALTVRWKDVYTLDE
jgi:hypothetical protein